MDKSLVDRAIRKTLGRPAGESQGQCPDLNQMSVYLELRCGAAERSHLEEHFASCEACRQVIALSLKISDMENGEARAQVVPSRRRVLFQFSIPVSALAAAALVIVAGVVVSWSIWQRLVNVPATEIAALRSAEKAPQPLIPTVPQPPVAAEARKDSPSQSDPAGTVVRRPGASPGLVASTAETRRAEVSPPLEKKAKKERGSRLADEAADRISKPLPAAPVPAEESAKAAEAKSQGPAPAKRAEGRFVAQTSERTQAAAQSDQMQFRGAPARAQAPGEAQPQRVMQGQAPAIQSAALSQGISERPQDALASFSSATPTARDAVHVRKLSGKSFHQWSGYWIDGQCAEYPQAPLVEVTQAAKEYEEVLGQFPSLRELQASALPVLLYWNGKIYLVR